MRPFQGRLTPFLRLAVNLLNPCGQATGGYRLTRSFLPWNKYSYASEWRLRNVRRHDALRKRLTLVIKSAPPSNQGTVL